MYSMQGTVFAVILSLPHMSQVLLYIYIYMLASQLMFFPPIKPEPALLQIFCYPPSFPVLSSCGIPFSHFFSFFFFFFFLFQRSQLCKSVQAKYILFILELSGIYHTYCSYLFIHPSVNIITYHKSFTFTLFYSHYLVLLLMLFILALLLSIFCVLI